MGATPLPSPTVTLAETVPTATATPEVTRPNVTVGGTRGGSFLPAPSSASGLGGALRVVAASPAERGAWHASFGTEWFNEHGFIKAGHGHERIATASTVGYGLNDRLELAASILTTTNHDTSTNPFFIAAYGDADLSARWVNNVVVADGIRVETGLRGGVKLYQGDAPGSKLGDAASPYGYGLFTIETEIWRMSFDGGYLVDRSKNLIPANIKPDAGQQYAYGIDQYNAVVGGAALDFPGWRFSPLAEFTFRNDLGAPGKPVATGTAGARWMSRGGRLSLTGAFDAGLSGQEIVAGRMRAPSYNVTGNLAFYFGARGRGRALPVTTPPPVSVPGLPPNFGVLKGRVFDDASNAPLKDVTILLDDGRSAVTDAEGRFQLPPVLRGPVKLAVRSDAFEGKGKTAFVTAGQATTLIFRLTKIPPPPPGTSRLTGAVVGPDGKFVAASMTVTSSTIGEKKLATDPDGKFRVELPVGAYSIAFSATGFEVHNEMGMLDANQESPLTVRLSKIPAPVVGGKLTLSGKVTGKAGVPVRATVAVRSAGKVQQMIAGPSGEYKADVSAGEVEVAVSAIGYATQTLKTTVAPGKPGTLDIVLKRPGQK